MKGLVEMQLSVPGPERNFWNLQSQFLGTSMSVSHMKTFRRRNGGTLSPLAKSCSSPATAVTILPSQKGPEEE